MKLKITQTAGGYLAQGRGVWAGAPTVNELIVILHNQGLRVSQPTNPYLILDEPPFVKTQPASVED